MSIFLVNAENKDHYTSQERDGKDNLHNEYFITFTDVFVPLLVRLFNVSFDSWNFSIHLDRSYYNSRSSQCSTTGVTKAVVCAILSVGRCI